jgi:hypothetical protein
MGISPPLHIQAFSVAELTGEQEPGRSEWMESFYVPRVAGKKIFQRAAKFTDSPAYISEGRRGLEAEDPENSMTYTPHCDFSENHRELRI